MNVLQNGSGFPQRLENKSSRGKDKDKSRNMKNWHKVMESYYQGFIVPHLYVFCLH